MSRTGSKKDVTFKTNKTTSGTEINPGSTQRTSLQSPVPDKPTLKKEKTPCKCRARSKSSSRSSSPSKDSKIPVPESQGILKPSLCSATYTKPNRQSLEMRAATPERDVSCKNAFGSVTYIKPEKRCSALRPISADQRISSSVKPQKDASKIPCPAKQPKGPIKCVCRSKSPNSPQINVTGTVQPKGLCSSSSKSPYSVPSESVGPCSCNISNSKPESSQPQKPEVSVIYAKDKGGMSYTQPKETRKITKGCICIKTDAPVSKFDYAQPKDIKQIDERKITKGCACIKTDAPESKLYYQQPKDIKQIEERKVAKGSISIKTDEPESKQATVCSGPCKSIAYSTTSVPINLRFQRSTKDPSTSEDEYRSPSLKNMSSSKQIVLPEVKIEIGPDRLKTIQIDVKPTDLNSKSSGIITIPVQLRFRSCCRNDEEIMSAKVESSEAERKINLKAPRTEKLLFEACANREYFENYMEALVDELPELERKRQKSIRALEKASESEQPVPAPCSKQPVSPCSKEPVSAPCSKQPDSAPCLKQIVSAPESEQPDSKIESEQQDPSSPIPTEELKTEDGRSKTELEEPEILKPKTEIIGMKETPWYEALDNENYIESYLVEGHCASTDNIGVQTNLVLGEKLLSISLNSVNEYKPQVPGCICGKKDVKASETIKWDQFILQPEVLPETKPKRPTVTIVDEKTPEENAAEPPPKMFSISPGQGPEPASSELPPLEPLPAKYSFVFRQDCADNYEPYLQALIREIRLKEVESPCGSKPKLPWTQLLLPDPKKNTIRRIMKLKVEPKPVCSQSAPCCCSGLTHDYDVAAEDTSYSCTDVDSEKSGVGYNRLMPLNTSSTKLMVQNTYKNKKYVCKTNPTLNKKFTMKAKFASGSQQGNMATKVSFKMEKNQTSCCQSGSQNYQTDSSQKNSKMVTCRYINRSYTDSTEKIKTCNLKTCQYEKPKFSLQPDPVVAAFYACEAELKPMREALLAVHQKLRNLNMPELDCMFKKNDFKDIPLVTKSCRCGNIEQKTPSSTPLNISRSKFSSHNNYNTSKCNSYQSYNATTNCVCKPLKRNKAIQKTGSMYKTNVRKRKRFAFSSEDTSTTDSTRYTPSEDCFMPCYSSTESKLLDRSSSPSKRQIRSQMSMNSMCPFIEAIKSILMMDKTNTQVTKCQRGKNISYNANVMTKQKKKMRVHMRIRPSNKNKI